MNKRNITFGLYCTVHGDGFGATVPYVNYFNKWGNIRLVNHLDDFDNMFNSVDVLVLVGGADVDTKRYGEKPLISTGMPNAHYEWLDSNLLPKWIKSGKPIVGICRGFQSLNVALGGTLFQHIRNHVQSESRSKTPHTLYTDIEGFEMHPINSFHHQCVRKLADELEMIGWCTIGKSDSRSIGKDMLYHRHIYELNDKKQSVRTIEDNYYAVPELAVGKTKPYVLCQYHPEEFDCQLFNILIEDMLTKYFDNNEYTTEEAAKATK